MSRMASGSKLELDRAIATIKGTPGSKPTWLSIAKSVEDVRKGGHWRGSFATPSAWLDFAAGSANLDANTIRRYLAAFEFLERKREANRKLAKLLDKADSRKISMAAVELIKRIDERSPHDADAALKAHISGDLTVRGAQSLYGQLKSKVDVIIGDPPYGDRSSQTSPPNVVSEHFDFLFKKMIGSVGPSSVVALDKPEKVLSYVRPDGILIGEDNAGRFLDGWEKRRLKEPVSRSTLISALSEITYSASFFRKYWVFVSGTRRSAEQLAHLLDDLSTKNVGISVEEEGHVQELLVPSAGPNPDRRELALAEVQSRNLK